MVMLYLLLRFALIVVYALLVGFGWFWASLLDCVVVCLICFNWVVC